MADRVRPLLAANGTASSQRLEHPFLYALGTCLAEEMAVDAFVNIAQRSSGTAVRTLLVPPR